MELRKLVRRNGKEDSKEDVREKKGRSITVEPLNADTFGTSE